MSDADTTVFISYRRNDNPDFVERIRDWFIHRYGRDHVFMDFDSIPPFVQFADYIREKVRACDVLIAIIGPQWLELLKQKAASFEEDYVRIEIATALQEGKLVAPICIKGASTPPVSALPVDLKPILDYNAAFLNSGTVFLDDIGRILDAVEAELERRENLTRLPSCSEKPSSAKDYFDRADRKYENKDYNGAIADYTEAIRLYPLYAEAYNNRGVAHKAKGDLDGAIADYNETLRLNPKVSDVHSNRGIARREKGDLNEAIADYNEAIRLNPQDALPYAGLGDCYYDLQQDVESLYYYQRCLKLPLSRENRTNIENRIQELKKKLNK